VAVVAELSVHPGRKLGRSWEPAVAPAVAATLALIAGIAGWRGSDLPAALYRISLFHTHGLTLWDSQWYGGHWTLDYSVIFPPIAGILGVQLTEITAVAVSALAFDRLAVAHFGRSARLGSIVFALGTLVQVAIGQLPFLTGEAFGLAALWAATRGRWRVAALLAACAALASPLAGAFVALAALAWLISDWPARRAQLIPLVGAALIPVAAVSLLFPGQGAMPFPFKDWAFSLAVYGAAALLLPKTARVLRIACGLYVIAFVFSFVLHTPVGGNIERLGEAFGPSVVGVALWPARRILLAVIAVPLIILQWGPALAALSTNGVDPSTKQAYFAPLVGYLTAHANPPGRVEIVPTALHWEAAYAAPSVPLARGWERQLDTANNPLFYGGQPLTPARYESWLLDNGVRFVALPDAALDYAGKAEGQLVAAGVPGLTPVWHDAHWRVFSVVGSTGIVSGPARPVVIDGGNVKLDMTGPGDALVRVRYTTHWSVVGGSACLSEDPGGWLRVQAWAPGPLHLELQLVGGHDNPC
jgi:hypothetical protein